MSDSQQPDAKPQQPNPFAGFFSYKGRAGRVQYVVGILAAFGCVVLAVALLAGASNPTGSGGAPALILPMLGLYFWFHSLATIKRLRDAGMPAWHYVIYGLGPIVWIALTTATMDLVEQNVALIGIGLAAFYVLPLLYSNKSDDTPPAATPTAP